MDGDDLFSNFKQKKDSSNKNEKDYLGKKRNSDNPLENEALLNNKIQKNENLNMGQNLESTKNNKKEENLNNTLTENDKLIDEINDKESLKKEKIYLKSQILKAFPGINDELKLLKNIPKIENENNNLNNYNKKNNIKNIAQIKEEKSTKSILVPSSPNQIPETTKLNFDYQLEKEKYDNLI